MEQIETISLFLKWGIAILLVLSIFSLKKGRQLARRYKHRKNQFKKGNHRLTTSKNRFKFSEGSIFRAAKVFSRKSNCYFAFDTDVLLEHPYVTTVITNKTKITILISQQVRYELDKIKDSASELSQNARIALKNIANLHRENKVEIVPVNKEFVRSNGLRTNVKDDLIIGSYLQRLEEKMNIIFITNDNNARTTARTTSLTPLELDWEEKSKKVKEVAFRPGYTYKLISLGLFSLAIGFVFGLFYIEEEVRVSATSQIKVQNIDEVTFKEDQPMYINSEYPYVIKNEYDEYFQGKKAGEWGAIAIVDTFYDEGSRLFPPSYSVVLGSWIPEEMEEKENKLKYVLVKENGEEIEQEYHNLMKYNKENGINLKSIDTSVKFDGVNSYEVIGFYLSKDVDVKSLKGTSLKLVHKVTKEVIQTVPLKIMKKSS
ncbi:PIN domain-containing protein [Bacillus sp. B190/17]|uniref:PIN domain-containing protein n=1 Tax=Bacillus lumedeiriae TaxID=3058829 RepID=A0ABW8IES7_9BACI